MRDHKNTKKMNFGINRNVMTLIGLLLLALGAMGRGIIQTRFLGVGAVNSDQLLEVLNASGGMQAAAAALVFEGLESCAAPIFAVLLIDGFQKTCSSMASRKAPTYRNTSFASLELQSSAKSHTITSFPANCWT